METSVRAKVEYGLKKYQKKENMFTAVLHYMS